MFTGIIRSVSPVISVLSQKENIVARIEKPRGWKLVLGQSIAINGVCSTVTKLGPTYFEVDWMPETIAKTSVSSYAKGTRVNLERSLTLQDFVDGHLVQGHVDGRGKIMEVKKETGKGTTISVKVPSAFVPYIAKKGSICLNGVSLTVTEIKGNTFSVAIIPYTLEHTNLGILTEGHEVNIEVDIIARYIQNHAHKK